jgi:RNA polymerase sigma factor (sigma-70 family)
VQAIRSPAGVHLKDNVERPSDAALIARVAAGECGALGAIYDRYAAALHRLARRLDPAESEDLLQATFLRAVQVSGRFSDQSPSARAWLFAIMVRVARERRRSLRRFARALSHFADARPSPVSLARETGPDLNRAVERLSPSKRVVLLLAEVEGFTSAEIAAMLELPIGTVWTRLHQARKELRVFGQEPALQPLRPQ